MTRDFNHGSRGSRLAWSSPDTCAEDERSESEGDTPAPKVSGCPTSNARSFAKQSRKRLCRADCKAVERTSRNAAKWTQGTAKGWEGCLWINNRISSVILFSFLYMPSAFGGQGCNPSYKRCKKIVDELWSNSAKRNFVDPFGVAQRAFPSFPW